MISNRKNNHTFVNFSLKFNLYWICTWNHVFEQFSVCHAGTKSCVTLEPRTRASQIWSQKMRETQKKKVTKQRGESFSRYKFIAKNVWGGPFRPPVFLGLMFQGFLMLYSAIWAIWALFYAFWYKMGLKKNSQSIQF